MCSPCHNYASHVSIPHFLTFNGIEENPVEGDKVEQGGAGLGAGLTAGCWQSRYSSKKGAGGE